MLHFDIPADKLCLHACGLFLNIHITVDYHFGHWSTLDITGISHELLVTLSDIHLIYMGEGRYGLLVKDNKTSPDVHSPRSTTMALHDTELKTTNNLQPQDESNTTGIYSDSTENYDFNEVNTSSDTVLYNSDTENYAQSDSY